MPRGARSTRDHVKRRKRHYPDNEREIRAAVYQRDAWTCRICGGQVDLHAEPNTPEAPTLDHLVPFSDGGEFTVENLRLAHRLCNQQRDL